MALFIIALFEWELALLDTSPFRWFLFATGRDGQYETLYLYLDRNPAFLSSEYASFFLDGSSVSVGLFVTRRDVDRMRHHGRIQL